MIGREKRKSSSISSSIVSTAKSSVLGRLDTIAGRCNPLMHTDLDAEEVDYMDCVARVYEGSDEPSSEGIYTSANSTHAEMNALATYIQTETDFETIDKIEITAPPCKSCAFVLHLLGVIDKVHTTKNIYKHYTGSWTWPQHLRDPSTFHLGRWNKIKGYFDKSGLSETQILDEVIKVVQTRSAL
jgi:deoxycytidylate deaminase